MKRFTLNGHEDEKGPVVLINDILEVLQDVERNVVSGSPNKEKKADFDYGSHCAIEAVRRAIWR